MVFPGDVLRFGASTRIYCVDGPEDFNRGSFQAKQQQAKTRNVQVAGQARSDDSLQQKVRVDTDDVGDNVDPVDDGEGDTSDIQLDLSDSSKIPPRLQKDWERYMAKKHKLENTELENDRIRSKGSNLSKGQEQQLQRNQERIQKLQSEVETLEADLLQRLGQSSGASSLKQQRNRRRPSEQSRHVADEEVDDRTTGRRDHSSLIGEGETQESLTNKWKRVQRQLQDQRVVTAARKRKLEGLQSQLSAMSDDSEDAFFLQNDISMAKDNMDKAQTTERHLHHDLDEIEKFLKTVSNGKLFVDRNTGFVGTEKPSVAMPPPMMAPPPPRVFPGGKPSTSVKAPPVPAFSVPAKPVMPPPSFVMAAPTAQAKPTDEHVNGEEEEQQEKAAPTQTRIVGPAMPPPPMVSTKPMVVPAPRKRAPVTQGSLSSILSQTQSDPTASSQPKPKKPKKQSTTSFDSKQDVWTAPKGQDGSGYTKLNAKFAGRY